MESELNPGIVLQENNMLLNMSMRRFLCISILTISLLPLLVWVYTGFMFFTKGLDGIIKFNLVQAIHQAYADRTNNNVFSGNSVIGTADKYEDIPDRIRRHFERPLKTNLLYCYDGDASENCLIFLLKLDSHGNEYYAWQERSEKEDDVILWPIELELIYILILMCIVIAILLYIFTTLLLKKVSKPSKDLAQWATTLTFNDITQPIPDFIYSELNNIARLIQNNFGREYMLIKKEEVFLRYTSHELRTPITTITISAQLLQKIIKMKQEEETQLGEIIQRIGRAANTMGNIVNTMLWVTYKNELIPSRENIDLSILVTDIVAEFNAVYETNKNAIKCTTSSFNICLVKEAAKVIIENLIRNALQYSTNGIIHINQEASRIEISNEFSETNDYKACGFGLGLELVNRLINRFGWSYDVEVTGSNYRAYIDFSSVGEQRYISEIFAYNKQTNEKL